MLHEAVLSHQGEFTSFRYGEHNIRFKTSAKLEKYIDFISKFEYKNDEYVLNIEGDYNIENSIAAIEAGKALDIEYSLIKRGLDEYKSIEKRWETEQVGKFNIINDSYNANPDSMKATLKTIFDLYPDALIVLGNMGELGEHEKEYHKEVGEFIQKNANPTNKVITIGNLAKEICSNNNFDTNADATRYIIENFNENTTIFFKASRSMKFEEIIAAIKESSKW